MLIKILNIYIKYFFLLTPFYVLSYYLTITSEFTIIQKRKIVLKFTLSMIVIALILLIGGNKIFSLFGITLDSFKIGTGAILFLSAISLIKGNNDFYKKTKNDNIAVVPLSMPIAIGPGTTGAILVSSSNIQNTQSFLIIFLGISFAMLTLGGMIFLAGFLEKLFGKQGIMILSKITGLMVAAIGAQLILVGIKSFFNI